MLRGLFVFLAVFLVFPLLSYSKPHTESDVFNYFCKNILQKNANVEFNEEFFSEEISNLLKKENFELLEKLRNLYLQELKAGCVKYQIRSDVGEHYIVEFQTQEESSLLINFSFKDNKVFGFYYAKFDYPLKEFESEKDVFNSLLLSDKEGAFSVYGRFKKENKPLIALNHNKPLAVASSFKLLVLAALQERISEKKANWVDHLAINNMYKSLPSGEMHTWPEGKKITLYEFAHKMISISDNTAADHLIAYLGKENIISFAKKIGVFNNKMTQNPFLTTKEVFILKSLEEQEIKHYKELSLSKKEKFILEKKENSYQNISLDYVSQNTPKAIDSLEWFLSTEELCKIMFYLNDFDSKEIQKILSSNLGVLKNDEREFVWNQMAYKGGSEPGVLNFTYLLTSNKNNRACFSITWNNPEESGLSHTIFSEITKNSIQFLEKKEPKKSFWSFILGGFFKG